MYKPVSTIPESHNCRTFRGIEASVCIRHFIANRSVKFGLKLWDVANSLTGYTMNFFSTLENLMKLTIMVQFIQ